ncbi:MAG: radical SAM family heme chaperone HemW [Candidatus Kuenenia sp.]|nr:radical SAM family heme chaperone HemW [Candidatus Kuenenia hertensis]
MNRIKPSLSSLYIHIPFCAKKCDYCDFNSIVSGSDIIDRYINTIDKELNAFAGKYVYDTVYIGGGTPTALNESQIRTLLCIMNHHIKNAGVPEYTVEANPGTLTKNKVRLLKEYGVNRISLGVQSFQDAYLKFLGRIHTGTVATQSIELLVSEGFKNINIDLIFGYPGQTLDEWMQDLHIAVGLQPEHISTYALTYEGETPLVKKARSGLVSRLDEDVELKMYQTAIRFLRENNYCHYEISNFAKPGYECFHNRNYWNNREYIGIGAGSFSFIAGERAMNERNVLHYIKGINENKNVKVFRESLPQHKYASETIVMALRMLHGISEVDFYNRFGYKIGDQFGTQINDLKHLGLVNYDDERLKLTEKGLFVADSVMAEFL